MNISVVVPGFNNHYRLWKRCVESLLNSGADEIVLVDDGSRVPFDGYTSNSPIVKTLSLEKNRGLAGARNAALDVVTGDLVTFVDSDDEVEPGIFTKCKDALQKSGADVALYGVRVIWPEDGLQKEDAVSADWVEKVAVPTPEDVLELHRRCLLNYSCNKVYRKAFLDQHGIRFDREGMPCEDIIFNLNCIRLGAMYCYLRDVGYVYYRTRGTLLARYKPTLELGAQLMSDTWSSYKDEVPCAKDILGDLGERSEARIADENWTNVWRPGTPFSFLERWRIRPGVPFLKMLIFSCLRRWFYIRAIRRWNTRRSYPNVTEWKDRER